MQGYLQNRSQRANMNNKFSLWKYIFAGVWQGSIEVPLIFNIYINSIFLFLILNVLATMLMILFFIQLEKITTLAET